MNAYGTASTSNNFYTRLLLSYRESLLNSFANTLFKLLSHFPSYLQATFFNRLKHNKKAQREK